MSTLLRNKHCYRFFHSPRKSSLKISVMFSIVLYLTIQNFHVIYLNRIPYSGTTGRASTWDWIIGKNLPSARSWANFRTIFSTAVTNSWPSSVSSIYPRVLLSTLTTLILRHCWGPISNRLWIVSPCGIIYLALMINFKMWLVHLMSSGANSWIFYPFVGSGEFKSFNYVKVTGCLSVCACT